MSSGTSNGKSLLHKAKAVVTTQVTLCVVISLIVPAPKLFITDNRTAKNSFYLEGIQNTFDVWVMDTRLDTG